MTKSCQGCVKCCEYAVIELPTPKSKLDIEEITWMLLHRIVIYIDKDHTFNAQINSRCIALTNGKCAIYAQRPLICRQYSLKNCEKYDKSTCVEFNDVTDWLAYVEANPKLRKLAQEF
ncbi:MAG: YkgJ family cysteine cluster protein [Candidatus Woesearchaeota archaeon]